MRFSTRARGVVGIVGIAGIAGVGFRGTRRGTRGIAPGGADGREGETRGETSSPRGRRAPLRVDASDAAAAAAAERVATRRTGSARCARRRRRRAEREEAEAKVAADKPPRERCARLPRGTRTRRCMRRTVRRREDGWRPATARRDKGGGGRVGRAILIRLEEYSTRRDGSAQRKTRRRDESRDESRISGIREWRAQCHRYERTNEQTGGSAVRDYESAQFATTRRSQSLRLPALNLEDAQPFAAASIG